MSGKPIVGETITGTKAVYTGGVPPVEVQSQFQKSPNGTSSWSGVDAWGSDDAGTHYIGPDDVGFYFRVAGRAVDSSEDSISKAETLMSFSEKLGPVTEAVSYEKLIVSAPVVTAEPIVGYTLSCSEPTITGGSGEVQVAYYWQDANNNRVLYMGSTQQVKEVDIGRDIQCQVVVTDAG